VPKYEFNQILFNALTTASIYVTVYLPLTC